MLARQRHNYMEKEMQKEKMVTAGRKTLTGVVVSDKMKDTIVVKVERFVKHPKYGKYSTLSKRFKAHDAGNTKKIGDKVVIEECRPMSREKRFRIIENAKIKVQNNNAKLKIGETE